MSTLPAGWTEEDFARLRRLWGAGEKTIVIATELGMPEGRVTGVIERYRDMFGNRDKRARARKRGRAMAQLWLQRRDEILMTSSASQSHGAAR